MKLEAEKAENGQERNAGRTVTHEWSRSSYAVIRVSLSEKGIALPVEDLAELEKAVREAKKRIHQARQGGE